MGNIYYEEGLQVLYEERRGRNKNMNSKQKKKKLFKEIEENLIAEIQQLRYEGIKITILYKRTKI